VQKNEASGIDFDVKIGSPPKKLKSTEAHKILTMRSFVICKFSFTTINPYVILIYNTLE